MKLLINWIIKVGRRFKLNLLLRPKGIKASTLIIVSKKIAELWKAKLSK
jgi:hypothetical protein